MADTGTNPRSEPRGEIVLDRRSIDAITSYEVTEEQLEIIQAGHTSNELNYSISLLSIAASLIVTLLTTHIDGSAKVAVFWSALIICIVLGSFFTLEYKKKRKSSTSIFEKIRAQKSTSALRDTTATTSQSTQQSN